jgi:hypothetical protein
MLERPQEWGFDQRGVGWQRPPPSEGIRPNYGEMTPEQIWKSVKAMTPAERKAIFDDIGPEKTAQVHEVRLRLSGVQDRR